ncbi:MAG: hypothetical protein JRG91_08130 [Deltaproteobacteria bacterium]|nr:hypothetical protein [Deltaproteobacteria bacterium]
MPGEEVQQEKGGLGQVLFGSLAFGLSLLPYGCSYRSKEAFEEAEWAAEEAAGEVERQAAPQVTSREMGEEGQMAQSAKDQTYDGNRYGVRKKGDFQGSEEPGGGMDGLGTIGKGGGGGSGSGYGRGSGGLKGQAHGRVRLGRRGPQGPPGGEGQVLGHHGAPRLAR